jgi:hypothetical protein
MTIDITGYQNPVLAVEACLKSLGLKTDKDSFGSLAAECADTFIEKGFLVESVEDIQYLCRLGSIVVVLKHDSTCFARKEEFHAKR